MSRPRAILSVSDKRGLAGLARGLSDLGWEIIGTRGTARAVRAAGRPATPAERLTGVPELLGGRVKTLDYRIFAGLLHRRDDTGDAHEVQLYGIPSVELVACTFHADEIDVGGPSMVRAAAKNHAWVIPLVDPDDYDPVLRSLRVGGGSPSAVPLRQRRVLAAKAFRCIAAYDTSIAAQLEEAGCCVSA